ncbi:exo-beta-N-acetylmuramidase NamZ domain-containing protein [Pseudomonas sp. A-RE-19]|uniref:exo-beta-N-acetylmuramidase NamZ domain-containing protein n=1 Tax=Pseudomonas sp. A-RE-19 TaxID=2832401 RepID=UPI001CC1590A|nr:exo-beta-N-acetylmuramidase NamZ domain-containing protein [Pseudomonas sp. A-RE-19]
MEPAQSLRSRRSATPLIGALKRWAMLLGMATVTQIASATDFDAVARLQVAQIVEGQIAAGRIPGAVVLIGDATHVRYRQAFGQRATAPSPEPMSLETEFDLASLTKVIATTTAIMQLAEAGRIDLDAPVARYWPAFASYGKDAVTVRNLLAHTSGLRPDLPARPVHPGREGVLSAIAAQRLRDAPGEHVIYSDLNFVVLGELVERITHSPLNAYCQVHIFGPLGMRDTVFLPDAQRAARSAPTIVNQAGILRGRVHDPTAQWMGGVSGNAGLFSTADDLARFAQMVLNQGRTGTRQILRPASIAALASAASPLDTVPWRGLGWELAAPFVPDHDRLPPIGVIGHTGYTGTGLWIDRVTGQFIIILSNRVYPDDSGDARPLRAQLLALLASRGASVSVAQIARGLPSALPALRAADRLPSSTGPVRTGIDVLQEQQFAPLVGMRVGLITNRSGFDANGRRTVDVLAHAPGVRLAALFSPEHGLNIDVDERVGDTLDAATGLTVHSLYGATQRFPAGSLKGLDALIFDIQDAGVRFFTYETTLGYALEAAAAQGIPLFVLDRPDPLGAQRFGGPVLDSRRESFTGYFPMPLQPGMTVGELASLFNRNKHIGADLRVVPMQGYQRAMTFADTGLGWVPLSPNLRTLAQLDLYPDVGLLEGANLSVGRGTPHPFEWIGAPWIDATRLANALNAFDVGAHFEPVDFVPTESTWRGRLCHGVSITRDTMPAQRPVANLGLALLASLHTLYPHVFDLAATRDSIGSQSVWQAIGDGATPDAAQALDAVPLARFARLRQENLRY